MGKGPFVSNCHLLEIILEVGNEEHLYSQKGRACALVLTSEGKLFNSGRDYDPVNGTVPAYHIFDVTKNQHDAHVAEGNLVTLAKEVFPLLQDHRVVHLNQMDDILPTGTLNSKGSMAKGTDGKADPNQPATVFATIFHIKYEHLKKGVIKFNSRRDAEYKAYLNSQFPEHITYKDYELESPHVEAKRVQKNENYAKRQKAKREEEAAIGDEALAALNESLGN